MNENTKNQVGEAVFMKLTHKEQFSGCALLLCSSESTRLCNSDPRWFLQASYVTLGF